jgi:putative membrane protein
MEPLVAYLHFLSLVLLGAFLAAELVVCRPGLGPEQVRLLRLFVYAKGLAFYLPNPAFHGKMALYVTIAGISVVPTVRFIRWRRALDAGSGPPDPTSVRAVRRLLHVELALLALMPLLAVLMARGLGR